MNKYEFNLKVEQIKKLAAKKEYREAAAIAKSLNWSKVKDWQALATAINVQEAVGDFEEARDMAILAYNRNLGGRKLVYKLTEFFIKVRDFDNAEALYEEYERAAHHDANRFILLYDLRVAEHAPDNELVEILETYRDHEVDEKYMYELAKLYYKTGRKEECVSTCDNIVLWFQDGMYVEKAIQLKENLNVALTNVQKKILEDVRKRKEDRSETMEILFKQQKELAALKKDDVEDELNESEGLKANSYTGEVFTLEREDNKETSDNTEEKEATDISSATQMAETKEMPDVTESKEMSEIAESNVVPDEEEPIQEFKAGRHTQEIKTLNVPGFDQAKKDGPLSIDLVQNEQNDQLKEIFMKALNGESAKPEQENPIQTEGLKVDKPEIASGTTVEGSTAFSNEVSKASQSLNELIKNAKQKLDSNYDKIHKESQEEQRREMEERLSKEAEEMDINVPVPNYNMYDTQRLQAELAEGMSDVFAEEEAGEFMAKQDTAPVDLESLKSHGINKEAVADEEEEIPEEQIEGQMNLADWMQNVKEEKYGSQDTKEFSKAELERYLDEKEEKSAAYEKLIAEKKAEALAKGNEIDNEQAAREALLQLVINSVRTDLALRTGKAIAKLEEAAAAEAAKIEVALVTATIPTVSDEMMSSIADIMEEEAKSNNMMAMEEAAASVADEDMAKEVDSNSLLDDDDDDDDEPVVKKAEAKKPVKRVPAKANMQVTSGKRLKGELAKIFRKYREMPGLEEQLVDLFESIDSEMQISNSSVGNILISGNSSSDKTDLARTIIRAINFLYPDQPKKIAKTSGDSINQRGIARAMSKLRGTALIVEGAGTIQPKRINELLNCLEQDTGRMIVIFEDSDTDMNVLVNFNPELTNVFNHRIILKQYTVNELVEMAKRFARKRQYEVDDDALLELYLKIDKLHGVNDNIRLDDIKEIINQAIINSEKRASRRLFGLKRRRGENGDVIFLTEADFKDK